MDPARSQAAAGLYSLSALAALQSNVAHFGVGQSQPSSALEFTGPPLGSDAEAALIDYRGEKVAGFELDGETMICLPQAYELFLKNLVGGLHTVYTKLKRLDITPRVCNVEQVRALRSLGAIQPGVNRCKLISCKDFDLLYQDCTSASSRPGRPPKRSPTFAPGADYLASLKKQRFLSDNDMKMGVGGGGGLFQPAQHLFPFLPFTAAQQLMMTQMMSAGAPPAAGSDDGLSPGPHDALRNSNGYVDSENNETNGGPSFGETGTQGPIVDGENVGEGSREAAQEAGDESSEHQSSNSNHSSSPQEAAAAFNPSRLSFSWQGTRTKLDNASESKDVDKFGGSSSSVNSLLMNVLGLIELAATTAKKQEEQLIREKTELGNLFEEEKRERIRLEAMLKQEERMRKLYEKKWRKVKKSKTEIHTQLLTLLENQYQQQRLQADQNLPQTSAAPSI